MEKTFARLAFILELGLCFGCGSQEIQVTPGPQLTEVLNNRESVRKIVQERESEEKKQRLEREFFDHLARCGLDHSPSKDEIKTLSENIEGRIETIHRANALPLQAISLRSQIFTAEGFRAWEQKQNPVTPSTVRISAPIIVRASCVFIDEGEALKTNGQDIFIFADLLKMSGAISTTPEVLDDHPGRDGGNIFVSTVQSDFGPHAKFQMDGANAGTIRTTPEIVLDASHPNDFSRIVQSIKAEVLDPIGVEKKVGDKRFPRADEARTLVTAWEKGRRAAGAAGAADVEGDIYNADFWENEDDKREIGKLAKLLGDERTSPSSRQSLIETQSDRVLKSWTRMITNAEQAFAEKLRDPFEAKYYYLIEGKLAVDIEDFEYFLAPKKYYAQTPFYDVKQVAYRQLEGGSAGRLNLRSLWINGRSEISYEMGQDSDSSRTPVGLEFKLPAGNLLQIQSEVFQSQRIVFHIEKTFDDKVAVSIPYTTERALSPTRQNSFNIFLRPSLGPIQLLEHSNRRKVPRPEPGENEITQEEDRVLNSFKDWGIQETPTKIYDGLKARLEAKKVGVRSD